MLKMCGASCKRLHVYIRQTLASQKVIIFEVEKKVFRR